MDAFLGIAGRRWRRRAGARPCAIGSPPYRPSKKVGARPRVEGAPRQPDARESSKGFARLIRPCRSSTPVLAADRRGRPDPGLVESRGWASLRPCGRRFIPFIIEGRMVAESAKYTRTKRTAAGVCGRVRGAVVANQPSKDAGTFALIGCGVIGTRRTRCTPRRRRLSVNWVQNTAWVAGTGAQREGRQPSYGAGGRWTQSWTRPRALGHPPAAGRSSLWRVSKPQLPFPHDFLTYTVNN